VSPLRAIARDLVERRLWPLAALLVLAIVAVPVVFLRPSDSSSGPAVIGTPAASAAAGATATTPATTTQTADAARKLNVKKSDAVPATGALKDPFVPAGGSSPTSGDSAANGSASSATADSAAAATTPATTTSTPATTTPATTTPAATTPASTTPSTPSPVTPSGSTKGSTKVLIADVRFARQGQTASAQPALRLRPYPTKYWPIVVYLGITGDKGRVAFAVSQAAKVTGGSCRPSRTMCRTVIVSKGHSVQVSVPGAGGLTRTYDIKLAAIRTRDLGSSSEAALGRRLVSRDGVCILHALGDYGFDWTTGTLTVNDDPVTCKYADPQPAASLPALK
jgi:hypothetical protein